MTLRPDDEDGEMRRRMKNPVKPTEEVELSPAVVNYLKAADSGKIKSEETLKKERMDKLRGSAVMQGLFCPECRNNTLNRSRDGWMCSICKFVTNAPLNLQRKI